MSVVKRYYFAELLRRGDFYYYNHERKRVYPDMKEYVPNAIRFMQYMEACQQKKMFCTYFDGARQEVKAFDYHNRYSLNYVMSVYARLKKLERWANTDYSGKITMMTLTISQKDKNIGQCLDELQEAKKNLFHVLRKIRSECGYLEYIWFIEPHKSGFPHCHVIIFTECDFKEKYEDRLKKLWAKKYKAGSMAHGLHIGSDEEDYKNNKSQDVQQYLTAYIFKYMGKTLLMALNPAYLVFHAEIWAKYQPAKTDKEGSYIAKVEKLANGKHKVISPGRGIYRLWDSSRGLKEIMKYEKSETKNCISMSCSGFKGEKIIYESENIDILTAIMRRKLQEII